MDKLISAAYRGVKVYVLVDSLRYWVDKNKKRKLKIAGG